MSDDYLRDNPHVYTTQEHPNDSPKDGTVHPIALRTLAAWEAIAHDWPLVYTDDGYQRCGVCTQSVIRSRDRHGRYYGIGLSEVLALTVAHLRQAHPELQEAINAIE